MQPATNIRELANNLIPDRPLIKGKDDQFYVSIYEDEIADLRDSVIHDKIQAQTLFVSGQTGTGKTTALHYLPDEEVEADFHVVSLDAKNLFELSDVSIIEILIMICYKLMDQDSTGQLSREFKMAIERLEKASKGILEEITTKESGLKTQAGGGLTAKASLNPLSKFLSLFNLEANFYTNLQADKSYRMVTREAFAFNKLQLLDITNKIVEQFLEKVANGKKLLLIINELDHIKNPSLIREIFIVNRQFLKGIKCKKVLSVPVSLIDDAEFLEPVKFFGLKLQPNPIISNHHDDDLIEKNRSILKDLLAKRIADKVDLIDPFATKLAIENSGGILRQYISILHTATKKVRRLKGKKVYEHNIKDGMSAFRQMLERSVVVKTEKITLLNEVRLNHQTEKAGTENFIECLLGNQILFYTNSTSWYAVNPLIQETIRLYAERNNQ